MLCETPICCNVGHASAAAPTAVGHQQGFSGELFFFSVAPNSHYFSKRQLRCSQAGISETIPLVFLLEHTLHCVINWALKAQHHKEDLQLCQDRWDPLPTVSTLMREQEADEEYKEGGLDASCEEEEEMGQVPRRHFTPSKTSENAHR